MSADDTPHSTLSDLTFAIGQVQVGWSFLENEMRRKLGAAGTQEAIAKGPVLNHWRTYIRRIAAEFDDNAIADYLTPIENLARTRNLLAHSIQSISVGRTETESAHAVCRGNDGLMHTLTIEMIRDLSKQLARIRMEIMGLPTFRHSGKV